MACSYWHFNWQRQRPTVAGTARQMFAPKTDAAAGLLRIGITCSCTLLQNCHRIAGSTLTLPTDHSTPLRSSGSKEHNCRLPLPLSDTRGTPTMAEEEESSPNEPHEPVDEDDDDAAGTIREIMDTPTPRRSRTRTRSPVAERSSSAKASGSAVTQTPRPRPRPVRRRQRVGLRCCQSPWGRYRVNQPDPHHRHQQTNHGWVEDADRRWWWEGRRHPPQKRPPVSCCSKGSTPFPSMLTRKAACHIRL